MATADYQEGLIERLQDAEYASEYLNEALKEASQAMFMLALRNVAKTKRIVQAEYARPTPDFPINAPYAAVLIVQLYLDTMNEQLSVL